MKRITDFFKGLWAIIASFGALAAFYFFHLKPKQDEKQRQKSRAEADALKAKLAAAKAQRDAQVTTQVAEVKAEQEALKQADSVDVANDLIAQAMKDGK